MDKTGSGGNALLGSIRLITASGKMETRLFNRYLSFRALRQTICLLGCLLGSIFPLAAQEFEHLGGAGGDRESTYLVKLKLDYLENERQTSETDYYDVYQQKIQKEGKGRLVFHGFHLDGLYQQNDSTVRIAEDESRLCHTRDSVGVWVEFLKYFYVYGQKRGLDSHYRFVDDGLPSFTENETASSLVRGIGIVLGDWRFGVSP